MKFEEICCSLERSETFAMHFLICLTHASNVIVQPDWTGTQTVNLFRYFLCRNRT